MRVPWILLMGLLMAAGAASAATVQVEVGHDDDQAGASYFQYYPPTVVVHQGDTVAWVSHSDDPHTVTAGTPNTAAGPPGQGPPPAFDSSPAFGTDPAQAAWFAPGGFLLTAESFNHTFTKPGDFEYFCKVHPGMTGWVHVVNTTASSAGGLLGGSTPTTAGNATWNAVYVDVGGGSGAVSIDRFMPGSITVPVGTTVVWTNKHSAEPHTVTSNSTAEPYDSSPNAPDFVHLTGPPPTGFAGQGAVLTEYANPTFNFTFDQPGTWAYMCKLHPGMTGTVIVLEKPPAANMTGPGPTQSGVSTSPTEGSQHTPGLDVPLLALGIAAAAFVAARRR